MAYVPEATGGRMSAVVTVMFLRQCFDTVACTACGKSYLQHWFTKDGLYGETCPGCQARAHRHMVRARRIYLLKFTMYNRLVSSLR